MRPPLLLPSRRPGLAGGCRRCAALSADLVARRQGSLPLRVSPYPSKGPHIGAHCRHRRPPRVCLLQVLDLLAGHLRLSRFSVLVYVTLAVSFSLGMSLVARCLSLCLCLSVSRVFSLSLSLGTSDPVSFVIQHWSFIYFLSTIFITSVGHRSSSVHHLSDLSFNYHPST